MLLNILYLENAPIYFYELCEHVWLPLAQGRGMGRGQKRKVQWFDPCDPA